MTWIKTEDGITSPHWKRRKLPEWEAQLMAQLGVTVMQRSFHTPGGCCCQWCTTRRAKRRANDEYQNGPRPNLTAEESAPAITYLRDAHASGLTCREIAEHLHLSYSYVSHLIAGHNKAMSRYTYKLVMGATWPEPRRSPGRWRGGNRVDSTGTLRRLAALNALGFSYRWMSERVGIADTQLANYVRGNRAVKWISRDVAEDVRVLYDKYQDQNPADHGMHPQRMAALINKHKRLLTPVPQCWDADTIDDPEAIAQWTGKCGSYAGYHAHRRYGIPACRPCKDAGNGNDRKRHAEKRRRLVESGS